ncbi:glycosyltransferase [Biomaibacter acetigenes]|jgi:glycosyltransferase involved in cell wall biosynthesis|uniref:Glycosyltransferase n=2 Tax=Biomaibacter acetigenes TaxID=2316383 RepID=A0A3G2R1V5_9FIRM|nr:glycosyltransferase [Biomaibacter acetigenes]
MEGIQAALFFERGERLMDKILYLPCFDFFNHPQRPQHLLWELSKLGFEVIYCNVTRSLPDFVRISPTFTLCGNVDALDLKKSYIMWLTHGPYADLLFNFNLRMVVSDFADATVDEFSQFAAYDEKKLEAADLVLAASQKIFDDLYNRHHNCHLIKNGVEFEHFNRSLSKGRIPQDLAKLMTKPIIGFWGVLAPWLDFPLIRTAADMRPNYNFVFLGAASAPVVNLPQGKNIFYLGPRNKEVLPDYARWFDTAIIPFEVKPVTLAADPLKAYEYLACGLPVVSTYLPQLEGMADVMLSRTPEEFISNLDRAVFSGKNPEAIESRIAFARRNSWGMRAAQVAKIIDDTLAFKIG